MKLRGMSSGKHGFTLLEMLLVVAIIAVVFAAATPLYTSLQSSVQLNEHTNELAQTIRTARTRALSRLNDAKHGVYVQSSQYTLYQGDTYATRDTSYDRIIPLDSALTLSNTFGGDIYFSKSLGIPSATGTITLSHDVQGTRTIIIDALGTVQQ